MSTPNDLFNHVSGQISRAIEHGSGGTKDKSGPSNALHGWLHVNSGIVVIWLASGRLWQIPCIVDDAHGCDLLSAWKLKIPFVSAGLN